MRSVWSGAITFGLIHIPVHLYPATKARKLPLEYLRKSDHCKIGMKRVCKTTDEEVPFSDIVRGFEYEPGKYVVLNDKDFQKAMLPKTSVIEIKEFVQDDDIESSYFIKPYFVRPDKESNKLYVLLLETMRHAKKTGIGKFIFHNKEQLVSLTAQNNHLMLNTLRFKEEVLEPDESMMPEAVKISDEELKMATKLIDQLSHHPFNPKKYRDTYTDELRELIEQKARGELVKAKAEKAAPTNISDIIKMLEKSLEAAEKHRIEQAEESEEREEKSESIRGSHRLRTDIGERPAQRVNQPSDKNAR